MTRITLVPSAIGYLLGSCLDSVFSFKKSDQSTQYGERMPRRLDTDTHIPKDFLLFFSNKGCLSIFG